MAILPFWRTSMKSESLFRAMILDEERCIRCALCVKRCPFDAITMERFELQEVSTDGRLYKESYRDAQLAGTPGVAGGAR